MPGKNMEKVNFFIIGVQKGGTTALDKYLRLSPEVQMSRLKETHFFDNEDMNWPTRNYDFFHRHFDFSSKKQLVRGEATPISCYWPQSLERIARYNSEAKIIMLLRHPAHRAYSHWRMESERKLEYLPFVRAIAAEGRNRLENSAGGVHRIFSYVERGFYAEQIERAFALFPKNQIFFLVTDELRINPIASLAAVHSFLGISTPNYLLRTFSPSYQIPFSEEENLKTLTQLYAENIQNTSALTGLSLEKWLDPTYAEAMPEIENRGKP